MLSEEAQHVLRDLNPWWSGRGPRPPPPPYRRPAIRALSARIARPKGLIEVVRGPRQVGKTTGLHQLVETCLQDGKPGTDILFVRFDLELLREEPAALRQILRWFESSVRKRSFADGAPTLLLLDEVHKLSHWSDEVKHIGDTFPLRMVVTGSSSVLVARGGRESLTGRVFTTELPPFSFREVLECWHPKRASSLPAPVSVGDAFSDGLVDFAQAFDGLKAQQKLALRRDLERYYNRGGYPRLHSGEVPDDQWADYIVQTIFENVLGADIPDLFPVDQPGLLRGIYLEVARRTGQEISQNAIANVMNEKGFSTNQPTVGKYLHYLADALLIREFRRYPLAKKSSARVPAKITLTDLGVRNAILRGAPSLWESDPTILGPLVETLVQGCLRGPNLQVHFYRSNEDPKNRRSRVREVDFVVERADGSVLPVEVKFRRRIDGEDLQNVLFFRSQFDAPRGVIVTRESLRWEPLHGVLSIPLESFLLAF